MKKISLLLITFFVAFSLCGNVSEARTTRQGQTKAPTTPKTEQLDDLEVHFIDVGQGDATLIKCGDAAMLIDAGDNDKGTLIQNYLKKQGVTELDYLVVTHPHADHAGGADVIITKFNIDTLIMPKFISNTKTYLDVVKAIDYKRYQVTLPKIGNTYQLGDAKFTIIAPNSAAYGDNVNNYSVGILLQHGEKRFLFTGDAEEEAEEDILENEIELSADVYKVSHHGSKTSSTKSFINAVKPEYAVISCAEGNDYGHPHAATLNTLRAAKVKLFRTDEQGSLIATSDGKKITWNATPTETWQAGEQKASPKPPVTAPKLEATPKASSSPQAEASPVVEEPQKEVQQEPKGITYVLNKKSKKFHRISCQSLPTTNRLDTDASREEVVAQGYDPCGNCKP